MSKVAIMCVQQEGDVTETLCLLTPTAYYSLLTAYYLLPTTHYLLQTIRLEEGDATEALCLALGDEVAGRFVESRELCVLLRLDGDLRRENERGDGGPEQREAFGEQLIVDSTLLTTS
jgi:hypothetical protein